MRKPGWTKETYEASVTSRCWAGTPYDAGWEESGKHGEDLPASSELRAIVEEEMALATIPDWAQEILDRMINGPLPTCGHYTFPCPLIDARDAIRNEKCPDFVCGCYTADPERKTLMSYYVYCLDAWLKHAPLEAAAAELAMRDSLGKNWGEIVSAICGTLGEHWPNKELLVARLVHRLRWWIKTLIWPDDKRDRFMLDAYLGDARGNEAEWGAYGNSPFGDPYFAELKVPEIVKLGGSIRKTMHDANELLVRIESTWLCAPKAFRYLEKLIAEIGSIGRESSRTTDTSLLQCEDTYPDVASCRTWYTAFMSAMTRWLDGDSETLDEFGAMTPVRHWLVRLFRHKLQLYEKYNNFGNLVGARPSGKTGAKAV